MGKNQAMKASYAALVEDLSVNTEADTPGKVF